MQRQFDKTRVRYNALLVLHQLLARILDHTRFHVLVIRTRRPNNQLHAKVVFAVNNWGIVGRTKHLYKRLQYAVRH